MHSAWIVLLILPILGGAERFNCRTRILGAYYADAKSGCKAFHVCVRVAGGGIRDFRFFCPPGTLFHQEAQTCTDWGDDDPLACPADLYDGQFDLYKIGSGYDTKKLSSPGHRDDEAEFGLQRAETGDRRLSQNSVSNGASSDLRASHSSDFFTGQRERGRDEASPAVQPSSQPPASSAPRQSFRRPTSPRTTYSTPRPTFPSTQYPTTNPPPPPKPYSQPQYDVQTKRKLVRKRPIYVSTQPPQSSLAQTTQFSEQPQQFSRRAPPPNRPSSVAPPANVPPQYKDEYVEVSRVTPKFNKYFSSNSSPAPFTQSSPSPKYNKKDGLVELYNYDAQSTPGLKKDTRPFKVRNNFNVAPIAPKEQDFVKTKSVTVNSNGERSSQDFKTASSQTFVSSTPAYKNFNSVSYEPEKNNYIQISNNNNNNLKYFNGGSPTPPPTRPTSTILTTRAEPPSNFNTIAYNTNIGFNSQSNNYADSDEDDGQYRPPHGEDDGQYRPELYERELLSGAHSLNIAASGNRLPEDNKQYSKPQKNIKPQIVAQTGAPRPFRPAPTPAAPSTTHAPEPTTTIKPSSANSQRSFDYFQTYTTTSRPSETSAPFNYSPVSNSPAPVRPSTTLAPNTPEPRPQTRAPAPPTRAPAPPTRAPAPPSSAPHKQTPTPHFAQPANNKEDNSYDYAYYDSDNGFSEYDRIEEFGKTKKA